MPVLTDVPAPWEPALGTAQHDLVFYSMVVAGLALFAQFVRTWNSTSEVSPRYRSAVYASLCVTGVAFLAYLYLVVKFDSAYVFDGTSYVPTDEARNTYLPRYMDWSVTVPLLVVELLALSALKGAAARTMRFVAMASAFLMIFTGFLGAGIIGSGRSSAALLVWGIISTVFYVVLYVVVIRMLRASKGEMSAQAYASYRNAVILLLSVWGWYPIAYAIHNWAAGSDATTIIQVGFSFADIAAKVGLGSLVHKVAKLRTAEDVAAGTETHPEPVWISSVKHSDGVQAEVKGLQSATRAFDGTGRRSDATAPTGATGAAREAAHGGAHDQGRSDSRQGADQQPTTRGRGEPGPRRR